jgi:modulator of FtsH protease HflC
MNPKINFILALGALALFIISGSFYIVNETQRGVKLQFGEVIDADIKPGIHLKIPLIQQVKYFDGRLQVLDSEESEFLTSEKKRLIVDSFIVWRIKDVERYYIRTQGEEATARSLVRPRVNDGLKNKIAERTLHQVVAVERDQIMENLRDEIKGIVGDELGMEIVDIRIKRVEFPKEVSETVYQRMRSERNRDAADHRARGRERAEGIKADADKQERILVAEAYRDAEKIRGNGDAKAASIYASAYGKDAKFYEFYRSLLAYKQSFSSKSDIMVIDPESEFFNYMNKSRN